MLSALRFIVGYYGMGVKLVSCQAHSVSSLEMLMLLTSNYSHSSVRSEQAWASLQSLQNFSFSSQYMTNYKSGKEMLFQMRHSAWEISIHFATAPIKELGNGLIYMGPCWHCQDDRWYLANQIKSKCDSLKKCGTLFQCSYMMFICKCIRDFLH